jgi:hypothetical protein
VTWAISIAVLGWALLGLLLWRDRDARGKLLAAESARDAAVKLLKERGAAYEADLMRLRSVTAEQKTRIAAALQEIAKCEAEIPGAQAAAITRLLGGSSGVVSGEVGG